MPVKKTVMFDPYTGHPRHPSDIASDPKGLLIVEDIAAPIKAAKTAAQRVKETEDRKRAAGLVRVCVWAHPEDATTIRAAAAKAAAARAKKEEQK